MAVKLVNRAWMTTATTGTGTITLGSAVAAHQTFAAAGIIDADEVRYTIIDGNNWEIGVGVYTAAGTTMSRTPSESSNSDAAIDLSGTATVFLTATAADIDNTIGGGEDPPVTPLTTTDQKESVRLATTANHGLSGVADIDGVTPVAGDRILVKDQTTASQNGIYVAAAGAWSRSTDADEDAEVTSGMLVFVEEGTASGDKIFALVTDDPITVGTTALTFDAVVLPSTAFVIKRVTAAAYTLILTDANRFIQADRGSSQTLTVPPNSSVKFAIGAEIYVQQWGAGAVTIAAGVGVTINSPFGLVFPRRYSAVKLKKMAVNTWALTEAPPLDATTSVSGIVEYATAAETRSATASKALSADLIETASALVALTDAATIALDWDSGITFSVTLGGNRTLGNPTNGQPGTWRTIIVTQDGTGSRTLAYDTQYKKPGGSITLTTTAAAVDVLSILCVTSSLFYVFSALDLS